MQIPARVRPGPAGSKAIVGVVRDLWALTKPEINLLIAITVLVSFLLARQGSHVPSILPLFNAMMGTLLVSSGAAALNQFIERGFDSRMRRTARRPVAMGRVAPGFALLFGAALSILGILYLELRVNPLSAIVAGLALAVYLMAYTPLKRITPLCTLVGAISGAAPPLIGWAAASGTLDHGAWNLYSMLFLWQFPHFMAIAWMYRDDYARAGYRVLPGYRERRLFAILQAAIPAVLLIPVSLAPWTGREAGNVYLIGATLLGAGFVSLALRFGLQTTNLSARRLLLASIFYLPLTLVLLLLDKR